jgi:hypothetical protein
LLFLSNAVRPETPASSLTSARQAAKGQSIALEMQDLIVPAETAQELVQLFEAPNHGRSPPKLSPHHRDKQAPRLDACQSVRHFCRGACEDLGH